MLFPYRTKNPPDHFPWITIGLIAVNTLVFLTSCDEHLQIRQSIVETCAVTHNTMYSEPWRIVSALFLHQNLFHLIGNMVFLWLFGASTEGRMRPGRFIALYLAAGLSGDILEDLFWGIGNPDVPSLGASGAIMGVAGAYLYLFPHSIICIFYLFGWFWYGVWECRAKWVIGFYVGGDILMTILFRGQDGVGHLAHIGGFAAGYLTVLLFRSRRDNEEISEIQAAHADLQDFTLLSVGELHTLMQQPTDNLELVLAYLDKISSTFDGNFNEALLVFNRYATLLLKEADPEVVARIVLRIPVQYGGVHPVFYLKLGSALEHRTSNDLAYQVYRRMYDLAPTAPDSEMALYRMAHIIEHAYRNHAQSVAVYQEMLRLFPNGELAVYARDALQRP